MPISHIDNVPGAGFETLRYVPRLCGARPSVCLVIEDGPTGVTAGIAAGMTVCGYPALTPASRLVADGAHRVFDDLPEPPAFIDSPRRA